MAKTIKVKEHPFLVRDVHSNAIINTDIKSHQQAKARREKAARMEQRMAAMEEELITLKNLFQKASK